MKNYIKRIVTEVFWQKVYPELNDLIEKQRALENHLGIQIYKPTNNYQVRTQPQGLSGLATSSTSNFTNTLNK